MESQNIIFLIITLGSSGNKKLKLTKLIQNVDRICGLVVRVPSYRSKRFRFRFPALLDFFRSSGSGTGSTQPREDNLGVT
jgi:hypothetical protein